MPCNSYAAQTETDQPRPHGREEDLQWHFSASVTIYSLAHLPIRFSGSTSPASRSDCVVADDVGVWSSHPSLLSFGRLAAKAIRSICVCNPDFQGGAHQIGHRSRLHLLH